jgi:hypothetical protein
VSDYEYCLSLIASHPSDTDVRAKMADATCEVTGFPADAVLESGDPTGFTLAQSLVLHQSALSARVRQACRGLTARGPWYRRSIKVVWGLSPPAVSDETGAPCRPYGRQRPPAAVTDRALERAPRAGATAVIQVGHLWLLRAFWAERCRAEGLKRAKGRYQKGGSQ